MAEKNNYLGYDEHYVPRGLCRGRAARANKHQVRWGLAVTMFGFGDDDEGELCIKHKL